AGCDADIHSPWNAVDAWWQNSLAHHVAFDFDDATGRHRVALWPGRDDRLRARIAEREFVLLLEHVGEGRVTMQVDGARVVGTVVARGDERYVFGEGLRHRCRRADPLAEHDPVEDGGGHLRAPMSGTIVAVLAKPGEVVAKTAPLVVLEAMKMEHTIVAPHAGTVTAVNCAVGERVAEGADLVDLDKAPGD
ncbi:MAG: acetyl-CoA carboxylase biotin carboxyl carrier protein subunit, partial [Burkholderiales bacterium]